MIQSPPVMHIIKISKSNEYLRLTLPPVAAAAAAEDDAELLVDLLPVYRPYNFALDSHNAHKLPLHCQFLFRILSKT